MKNNDSNNQKKQAPVIVPLPANGNDKAVEKKKAFKEGIKDDTVNLEKNEKNSAGR